MINKFSTKRLESNSPANILKEVKRNLIDKQADNLIDQVKWMNIKEFSIDNSGLYPIAILGKGSPVLLLHGFDSCFLEYRRLVPLIKQNNKLIIPDLYGFGFCPRTTSNDYGFKFLMQYLNAILDKFHVTQPMGIIGASMGGALAIELARKNPTRINKLLLLSPAGLSGEAKKIPWPLNQIGACFLRQSFVRKALCRQAFANPSKNVGPAEEQIASAHLSVPGWQNSLANFARNGGVAGCGLPIPSQPIQIILGRQDRIIPKAEKEQIHKIYSKEVTMLDNCGHLPHLERPDIVAKNWSKFK